MMMVSSLPSTVADIALPTILLLFAPTAFIVLVAGLEVFWHVWVKQKHALPDTVILLDSPWPIIIPTAILLLCCTTPLFVSLDGTGKYVVVWSGLSAFLYACSGLLNFSVVFIADGVGLTRRIFFFSKTLPWATIDWVYLKQANRPAQRTALWGRTIYYKLIVEAGPKQRFKVLLRPRRTRVQPDTLRQTIQERATKALVGYDKQEEVQKRRADKTHTRPHQAQHH